MRKSRFLFANPPLKKKSHIFSSRIPHFTLKTSVFSSQVLQLSENHAFSLRESPI
ncbi:hypothetical protein CP10139811_1280 [Chlamydia ibidis]|uniref:Uncharacterized protein n=1 Tax=Chlamydia ibidis TaxID=1405396 RepID=S7KFP9_9CHLA|nr:hypothetical protein CP082626L3_1344 [Chlamydia psittaci 08-2626_L3]EPP35016.1 hypothetical protein CP10139811_1280 [Chlamydia ibidis]